MPHTLPAPTTALVLIDLQQALFQPAPRPHEADAVVQRINALAARARAAGVPVLWVQHETAPGHRLAHGSPGWALADGLQPADGDVRIRKTTPDSFLHTGLADWLAVDGKPPATVVVIGIALVFFQCARALLRSQLWQSASWPDRSSLPTAGQMLTAATGGSFDGAAYDAALPLRQQGSLC